MFLKKKVQYFFQKKHTSIIDCKKRVKLLSAIGVDKIKDYEGFVLLAIDKSRANEDLEIIYDDEDEDDLTEENKGDNYV